MQKDSREFVFERQRLVRILFAAAVVYLTAAQPMFGQDDVTTQNATSALGGAWITGPASNPLSGSRASSAWMTFLTGAAPQVLRRSTLILSGCALPSRRIRWTGASLIRCCGR